jgi:hypothetical protein
MCHDCMKIGGRAVYRSNKLGKLFAFGFRLCDLQSKVKRATLCSGGRCAN